MLVLTRKIGERLLIGDSIVLTVVQIHGSNVRIGIEAPTDVTILREELRCRPDSTEPRSARSTGR